MLCVKPGQAIPALVQGLREALQLRVIDESHAMGDLLRTCDPHSLALLQCLHECCGMSAKARATRSRRMKSAPIENAWASPLGPHVIESHCSDIPDASAAERSIVCRAAVQRVPARRSIAGARGKVRASPQGGVDM
jgi:hypothetical protein